jgi:hypothetical protein
VGSSTRGRRLPIRRSDPGPITRAGVVSLWARGRRAWRKPTPGFVGGPRRADSQSARREPAPPLLHEAAPRLRSDEGPLHPCLVTDVGVSSPYGPSLRMRPRPPLRPRTVAPARGPHLSLISRTDGCGGGGRRDGRLGCLGRTDWCSRTESRPVVEASVAPPPLGEPQADGPRYAVGRRHRSGRSRDSRRHR